MVGGKLAVASWREMRRHPSQTLLSVLGVALGIAVLVAIELANESARRAFDLSLDSLSGAATHRIVADDGVPESVYVAVRLAGFRPSSPVVAGLARIDGETFHLIGIDPLVAAALRPAGGGIEGSDLSALLTRPATVLLGSRDLSRLELAVGDVLAMEIAGTHNDVTVVGRIDSDNPVALEGVILADIATAQELLDRIGMLDRIDIAPDEEQLARLRRILPTGVRVEPADDNRDVQRRMTEAFHTNLAAMGLLALLVGVLLVYNTITFSVLRRRGLLGLLRVLGATRGDLFRIVMIESLAIGLVGTLLGLALGVLLGQGLVQLVTRTINDLYFVLTVSSLLVSPAVLLKGFVVGLLATAAAAFGPALEAARSVPQAAVRRSGVERHHHAVTPWLAVAGAALICAGLLGTGIQTSQLGLAFGALFLCVLGFALLVPAALLLLTRWFGPLAQRLFGRVGRLAARGIGAGLSRSGMAVAALTVAVSATVGVGIMVDSFRATVRLWLAQTLTSDIYVTLPGSMAERNRRSLGAELLAALEAIDGVASVSTTRAREIDGDSGPVVLVALGDAPQVVTGFRFKSLADDDPWPAYRRGESVFVSEAFAYHNGLVPGDTLGLDTPDGRREFSVGAVYFDYSTDRGIVTMDRSVYTQLWRDPGVTTAGLKLAAGIAISPVMARVRELTARSERPLLVRANAEIRSASMDVFDRTFTITGVLRLLAVGVAFIGVLSALMALQLERAREHATLRALGLTPRQLTGLVAIECGLMGLAAGLLSLPLGWLMSHLLIDVVNQRSFGWSMQSLLPAGVLADALVLAVVAALMAGLYPAWRVAQTPPALALREE